MKKLTEPPLVNPDRIMFWFLLSIVVFIISFILVFRTAKVEINKDDLSSRDYYLESQFANYRNGVEIPLQITKGSLVGHGVPYLINREVYGILIDENLYKILNCESKFDPTVCNIEFGCGSGIGLGQLTAIAIKDCEKNLDKRIDPYSPHENLECSIWLYETYGTEPWGTAYTDWGSHKCWSK